MEEKVEIRDNVRNEVFDRIETIGFPGPVQDINVWSARRTHMLL